MALLVMAEKWKICYAVMVHARYVRSACEVHARYHLYSKQNIMPQDPWSYTKCGSVLRKEKTLRCETRTSILNRASHEKTLHGNLHLLRFRQFCPFAPRGYMPLQEETDTEYIVCDRMHVHGKAQPFQKLRDIRTAKLHVTKKKKAAFPFRKGNLIRASLNRSSRENGYIRGACVGLLHLITKVG